MKIEIFEKQNLREHIENIYEKDLQKKVLSEIFSIIEKFGDEINIDYQPQSNNDESLRIKKIIEKKKKEIEKFKIFENQFKIDLEKLKKINKESKEICEKMLRG